MGGKEQEIPHSDDESPAEQQPFGGGVNKPELQPPRGVEQGSEPDRLGPSGLTAGQGRARIFNDVDSKATPGDESEAGRAAEPLRGAEGSGTAPGDQEDEILSDGTRCPFSNLHPTNEKAGATVRFQSKFR